MVLNDLLWELNRDHSVVFETAPKYCISDSLVDYDGYSISSKRFLPTIVDIVHFSLLNSKMSVFTLAISSLTTSNLP